MFHGHPRCGDVVDEAVTGYREISTCPGEQCLGGAAEDEGGGGGGQGILFEGYVMGRARVRNERSG